MKILYFNDFRLGVLKADNSVVDVTSVVQDIPHTGPGDLINGLIERFDQYRAKLEAAAQSAPSASARPCRSRSTSTAWRSTIWKTARAARRRRSTAFTNRRGRL